MTIRCWVHCEMNLSHNFAYLTSVSIFSVGRPQKYFSFPRSISVQNWHHPGKVYSPLPWIQAVWWIIAASFSGRLERKFLDLPTATRSGLLLVHNFPGLWIGSDFRIGWEAMIPSYRAKLFSFHQIFFVYTNHAGSHLLILKLNQL